ncbi:hypothetical protein BDV35DRAFT_372325 [Aspergillus flavus]|uniref:Unnamed protein product n=3 Tax=Aspergillus subgen. Circumdati TaxID=2720871 RepID=A0AAN5C3C9_ASPOZ|nr:hypothetical protein BDV35DRAFT_372325 [Aspergillus flavus]GMF81605.1 unnamed protein product [Aspergillus oryzae]GMG53668.1 unnamed protein product [Aspergillus oryzae var. brunneus]RAQ61145.1 hypothetical protein COH20_012662 [Aspergillus flavus]RAQ79379.1 hypothetical protein COH21_006008 [Aspergillus flavus]
MSMSSPSIIFHQGLRCTKVPRRSAAAISPSLNLLASTSSSITTASTDKPISTTDPSPAVETSLLNDHTTLSTSQVTPSESSTKTPNTIPTHLPPVSSFTITTTVSGTSPLITEGITKTYSPVSSYGASYSTLESIASSLSSNFSSSSSTEAVLTHTSRTGGPPTATTSTVSGGILPKNNSDHGDSLSSPDHGSQASLRTLLGSVLGAMGFIAAVFLICLLLFRRRRRRSGGVQCFGGNEKLLRADRQSADSLTGLQHGYVSGGSMRSQYKYALEAPMSAYYHDESDRASACYSDPFSDSAELHGGLRNGMPEIEDTTQSLFMNQKYDQQPVIPRANLPLRTVSDSLLPTVHAGRRRSELPLGSEHGSIYSSDRSLGSTLILPGRSSLGSSLQRFSYRVSVAELEPCGANEPVSKISPRSTRSDPFDLEVPARAVHPISSATQLRP